MEQKEKKKIEKLYLQLIKSELHRFPKFRRKLNVPKKPGVYIIYNPERIIEHVGRTRAGLHQRLYNHLEGLSSFVSKFLKGKKEKLRQGYMFKYLIIENERKRALLEALAIGKLCPKHIG